MSKIPAILSWSGGKDCSYALHLLRQQEEYEVKFLLATFDDVSKKLNMHGVHISLIEEQCSAIGIPLISMFVSDSSNAAYEQQLAKALAPARQAGIHTILFGDIFLEDLRSYREVALGKLGFDGVYPLWKMDTSRLVRQLVEAGFHSTICCINHRLLPMHWLGKTIDSGFIDQLPENIDPCGENGEYHSFCTDGPIFSNPIGIHRGKIHQQAPARQESSIQFDHFSWMDLHLSANQ